MVSFGKKLSNAVNRASKASRRRRASTSTNNSHGPTKNKDKNPNHSMFEGMEGEDLHSNSNTDQPTSPSGHSMGEHLNTEKPETGTEGGQAASEEQLEKQTYESQSANKGGEKGSFHTQQNGLEAEQHKIPKHGAGNSNYGGTGGAKQPARTNKSEVAEGAKKGGIKGAAVGAAKSAGKKVIGKAATKAMSSPGAQMMILMIAFLLSFVIPGAVISFMVPGGLIVKVLARIFGTATLTMIQFTIVGWMVMIPIAIFIVIIKMSIVAMKIGKN